MFIEQFLKGNNIEQLRLHNDRYYAHAQLFNSSVSVKIQLILCECLLDSL